MHEKANAYMNERTRQTPMKFMKFIPRTQNVI